MNERMNQRTKDSPPLPPGLLDGTWRFLFIYIFAPPRRRRISAGRVGRLLRWLWGESKPTNGRIRTVGDESAAFPSLFPFPPPWARCRLESTYRVLEGVKKESCRRIARGREQERDN